MELPFGGEGRKATHDFLSLYSSSSAHAHQQDPAPPQGGYLKTHDFLQPLERIGKSTTKEENRGGLGTVEKAPAPGPGASGEHMLPGGIGTYSISYINQRCMKPDRSFFTTTTRKDENSNSSCGGFTSWDEAGGVQKGKTGKENIAAAAKRHALQEASVAAMSGQWPPLLNKHNPINATTFSSLSSSQPSTSQKSQSFMDMIASPDEDEEDEEDEEFVIKKESSPHPKGNPSIKVEPKTIEQKPSTPRSKHSATEQRRRCKINDRFLKLREVIPNSDQKRDKASFLLEVIEYIQFLQEKVNRYESSYEAWSHEPSKLMHWRNSHVVDGFIPINGHNLIDSDTSTATTFKERGQQPELASKVAPVHQTIQPSTFTLGRTASPVSVKEGLDTDRTMTWPPSHKGSRTTPDCDGFGNRTKEQELAIENGTINISSMYSQGLLNALTEALRKSGVDLSEASLSVKIDLGNRANPSSAAKEDKTADASPGDAIKKRRTW